jgi:tellurite resistance protein
MPASKSTISPELAIAVVGLYSAYSNEEMSSQEDFALESILSKISQFEDYTDDQFSDLSDKALGFIEEEGVEEAYKQAIKSLPNKSYKEAAMLAALAVIAVDGDVPEEEEEFLVQLQESLKISDERFDEILDDFFDDED